MNKIFTDGQWIAVDGSFFKKCESVEVKPFMDIFRGYEKDTIRLYAYGTINLDGINALRLATNRVHKSTTEMYMIPYDQAQAIGYRFAGRGFTFRLNKDFGMVFIYKAKELIGGVMLLVAKEESQNDSLPNNPTTESA